MPEADFSKRARSYEAQAHIQEKYAENLVKGSSKLIPKTAKIADLGCGTGSIGKLLTINNPEYFIENYDISREMLDVAKENLSQKRNSFYVGSSPLNSKYDLIISNFALQWFEDISVTIQDCLKKLKDGGILSICLPVEGSFRTLKESFKAVNAEEYFFKFPEAEIIQNAVKKNEIVLCELINEDQKFDSTLDFFKNIHGIGANQTEIRLDTGKLRKLIEYHDELFDGKIIVRYKILELIVKRVIS